MKINSKKYFNLGDPERKNIARYPNGLVYGKAQLDHLVRFTLMIIFF
jgi:hypothetical protein